MYIENKIHTTIENLTTTTIIHSPNTVTKQSDDNNHDTIRILYYSIPLSCVTIILVVVIVIGFTRRRHVLEKWTSLKRMRNTNPNYFEATGLRRNSEYDLCNDGFEQVTTINDDGVSDFRLSTIT